MRNRLAHRDSTRTPATVCRCALGTCDPLPIFPNTPDGALEDGMGLDVGRRGLAARPLPLFAVGAVGEGAIAGCENAGSESSSSSSSSSTENIEPRYWS